MRALMIVCVAASLAAGCVEQAEPPRTTGPAVSSRERIVYSHDPASAAQLVPAIDALDAERVRAALFPKSLRERAACRLRADEPNTWVAVDERQGENYAAGEYVPHVTNRYEGSFTDPSASELLFVIAIENCQPNTFGHRVVAVFPRGEFERAVPSRVPAPSLRFDDHPLGSASIVAVLGAEREAPRFVEVTPNEVRVVELNRDFARDASFGLSDNAVHLDGTPMPEHWRVLQRFHALGDGTCRTLVVTSTQPRSVREERRPCSVDAKKP